MKADEGGSGQAAALRGMTVTSFIHGTLEIAAERTLRRIETRELTDRDSATLLARLAVDKAWQGRGIGAVLLAHALRVAVEGAELIASAVIEVDAKDDTARSFYARFGFRSLSDDRLHMFLPMETARQATGSSRG